MACVEISATPARLRHGDSLPSLPARKREHWTQGSGRLDLAKALVSRSNPLTARVVANRVWMYHFGEGIVRSPGDFGIRGERPTHPELLDWLASHLMNSNWSLKDLHRTIMLSAAYQMSSETRPALSAPNGPALSRAERAHSPSEG